MTVLDYILLTHYNSTVTAIKNAYLAQNYCVCLVHMHATARPLVYIYIYIYVCVCVCVLLCGGLGIRSPYLVSLTLEVGALYGK